MRKLPNEHVEELNSLLGSIINLNSDGIPDKEIFSLLIKKFLYKISTISDDYFLTDICESTYELFVEFRIILGYYEKSNYKKLKVAIGDVVDMSINIYNRYKEFLEDPGYNGTNFPKPRKLKAMRELAEIVGEGEEFVVLPKRMKREEQRNGYVASYEDSKKIKDPVVSKLNLQKKVNNEDGVNVKVMENKKKIKDDKLPTNIKILNTNHVTVISPSDSGSSGSFNAEINISKTYETPLTPELYYEEVLRGPSPTDNKMMNCDNHIRHINNQQKPHHQPQKQQHCVSRKKDINSSMMVAAMCELMAPPPPPSSSHGRIPYVLKLDNGKEIPPRVPTRRSRPGLKPPLLVDEDGDILPAKLPQLKSAAASIYESSGGKIVVDDQCNFDLFSLDTPKGFTPRHGQSKVLEDDDSFILAYRQSALKNQMSGNNETERDEIDLRALESSGWSSRNRV